MKITIKIDPDTLLLIQKIELTYSNLNAESREERIQKSIRQDLFEKLSRACISYTANPNGKERNITLKYHLAHRLFDDIVFTLYQKTFGIYEACKLDKLKNELHQKLL